MVSDRPLQGDITATGQNQFDIHAWAANMTDLIVEIQSDHATTKTTVDGLKTLTDELRTDHATYLTLTSANKVAVNALITAAGTTSASFAGLGAVSAVSAADVATITAAAAATGPGTLTNATAPTLLRA